MISAAIEARTACVCHKQAAVGQYHYISKRKKKKKYYPKIDENAAMKIELLQLLQLVYINLHILTERI